MPNNKKKSISSIKSSESIHPYSRKAHQMKRAFQRQEKLSESSMLKQSSRSDKMALLSFIKSKLTLETEQVHHTTMDEWILIYINRHEEEMKELETKVRKGRPHPPRLELLKSLTKKEMLEYEEQGVHVPILSDAKKVLMLRTWNEDYNALDQIPTKLLKRSELLSGNK